MLKFPLVAGTQPSAAHQRAVSQSAFASSAIALDFAAIGATSVSSKKYNQLLLTAAQRDRITVVLVNPRNPLNIGAVARAMANFGFSHLSVVGAYDPHWREARSAIGAPELLASACEHATLSDAVAHQTLVLGTGTLTYRKPDQTVISLPELGPVIHQELARKGGIAILFGSEKRGLSREDLSYCHALVEIPTDARQPSMNLGQAAAVCLYELACGNARIIGETSPSPAVIDSAIVERLGDLIQQTMIAADYSPESMHETNRHDLRVLLRRLKLSPLDARRILGLFRRILNRLTK
jgi:TrmH family RNA methyltransferase